VELSGLAEAGYALTILPDVLWREMVSAAETTLAGIAAGRLPSQTEGLTVRDLFARVGADDWDRLRDAFAEPARAAE
jgi:2-methylisocitrate lyase-like PEP mutase family enzyme